MKTGNDDKKHPTQEIVDEFFKLDNLQQREFIQSLDMNLLSAALEKSKNEGHEKPGCAAALERGVSKEEEQEGMAQGHKKKAEKPSPATTLVQDASKEEPKEKRWRSTPGQENEPRRPGRAVYLLAGEEGQEDMSRAVHVPEVRVPASTTSSNDISSIQSSTGNS